MLGKWNGSNGSELLIVKDGAYHYIITLKTDSEVADIRIEMRAHHASVGEKDVVWLQWDPPVKDGNAKKPVSWLPCIYEVGPEKNLTISIPNDEKLPLLSLLAQSRSNSLSEYYKKAIPREDFFFPIPTKFTR